MAAMILAMQILVVTTSAMFEANADLSPYRAELAVAKGEVNFRLARDTST